MCGRIVAKVSLRAFSTWGPSWVTSRMSWSVLVPCEYPILQKHDTIPNSL